MCQQTIAQVPQCDTRGGTARRYLLCASQFGVSPIQSAVLRLWLMRGALPSALLLPCEPSTSIFRVAAERLLYRIPVIELDG